MTITDVRPLQASFVQTGEVFVEAWAVDGGGLVPLTVEWVSTASASEDRPTVLLRLVGATSRELTTPGRHRAHQEGRSFDLNLTRVARRGSLVSYAASVTVSS